MITVHIVLNAHIDPVWLWPWQAGADEVLATCRSACDRLDAHPDIVFTRGEAWAYDLVERLDPPLFARVRAHIEARRWEIAGGWWIQPDCNLPTETGMRRQIELGRDWFQDRFGVFPRVAFNVDSFGHAGVLPGLMRAYGQDRYVMMRPQEHEMILPARLFRWRGAEGEAEVAVFRIAREYSTREVTADHVLASLEDLPQGVRHTMCFVGVGDHGGGPTERQIAWCRAHAAALPGCRLVFSSPARFFDAVEADGAPLPLVTGELQHHAVGCYSVMRPIKLAVRRAEHALASAEIAAALDPDGRAAAESRLAAAWRDVCFNHFHDTLGGTCIPSAYRQALDQVGGAAAWADAVAHAALRRGLLKLPGDPRQRLVLFNPSDRPFAGAAILAPWTQARWRSHWRLIDEAGAVVPHQPIAQEAAAFFPRRLLVPLQIPARGQRVLSIDRGDTETDDAALPRARGRTPASVREIDLGAAAARFAGRTGLAFPGLAVTPRLELFEDPTDTWAHGAVRLGARRVALDLWGDARLVDEGPIMRSAIRRGRIADSTLHAEWRVYAGEPSVELILRIGWRAAHRVLKLVMPLSVAGRTDGVMAGGADRALDGRERPMQDFSLLHRRRGHPFGIVAPDVFALDGDAAGVRLTLLRSPLMAHHDPAPAADFPRAIHADQGTHEFRFFFASFDGLDADWLATRATMLQRPLLAADLTRGMTRRGDGWD